MYKLLTDWPVLDLVLLAVFSVCLLIQLFDYLFVFLRAARKSPELNRRKRKYVPVSVVICAKNEAENLKMNLLSVLEQDYPDFEVVVVDDCSEDETPDILRAFAKKYPRLKISTIKKDPVFTHGKKLALTIGIKAARNEYLLLTDADCRPAGNEWIRYMARHFEDGKEIVAGVGLYHRKKGLLNLFIRIETAFIYMQYAGISNWGRPYMGVGRNLAYRKELFFNNKGFASHAHLSSGDDDLFISEVAKRGNLIIENQAESFTYSEPETSFKQWMYQKRRHLQTGSYYRPAVKLILGMEFLSRTFLNLSFAGLLIVFPYRLWVLAVYSALLLVKLLVLWLVFKRLKERFLCLPSLLAEPFIPFLYAWLHLSNRLDRRKRT